MADLVWGEPVVGGETVPGDRTARLYRINDDGTRRSIRYHPSGSNTGIYVRHDGIVKEESAGCIPHKLLTTIDPFYEVPVTSLSDKDRDEGRYVGFANEGGACYFGPEGTTPGTPFYRIRRILGQHALRYISEHNPSQLRYADPSVHRVETIAHELTDQERVQAANSDEYIRGQTGLLWGFNEFMRYTPANRADLWKPLVAELDAFLAPYCALCEGSGMSHGPSASIPTWTGRSGRWQGSGSAWIGPLRRHRFTRMESSPPPLEWPTKPTSPTRSTGRPKGMSMMTTWPPDHSLPITRPTLSCRTSEPT